MIPVALFLPGINGFAYPSMDSYFSDIAISHYPNALYLKNALLEQHTIPLWSDAILGGAPFAANPLSGLWYPPGWLALLFPLPLGFNIIVIAHIILGGIGLALFLRQLSLSDSSAIFGGLAFSLMPKYFAHFGAGHLTLCYAVPLTPWLLLAASSQKKKWYTQPGLILGLIFLADVRWAAFAGLLWLAWEISQRKSIWLDWGKNISAQIVLAALFAAPLALPLLEFMRLSTRTQLEAKDILSFSLPPLRLLGLLFPDLGGFHEFTIYSGAVILLLAFVALLSKSLRKKTAFWLGLVAVTWVYSLGEYFPGLSYLAEIPGFSLLRVPPRILFLSGLGLAVLAAHGLDYLIQDHRNSKELKIIRMGFVAIFSFSIFVFLAIWLSSGSVAINYLWGLSFLIIAFVWIFLALANKVKPRVWQFGVFLILVADLFFVAQSSFVIRPVDQVLSEGQQVAMYIANQPEKFRVYSPSYSIPQQTAAFYGLSLADGVDPMQRKNYIAYMDEATGVPRDGYSVTLPPFTSDDLSNVNQAYLPDETLLGALGIGYIVADFELPFSEIVRFGNTRVYQIDAANPYLMEPLNQIQINGFASEVKLSALSYPGWQAWVDGERVEIEKVDALFSGLKLEEGEHEIVFKFRPISVYMGVGLGIIGIIILFIWQRRQIR